MSSSALTHQPHNDNPMTNSATHLPRIIAIVLRTFIAVAIPLLLVLIGARLLMSPLFFSFEYNRADFPSDYYGFTREDRLKYTPYATEYLINGADINFLGDLTFPDGSPLFNAHELQHMRDVKVLTTEAFILATVVGILSIVFAVVLWRTNRRDLKIGLRAGALLTLGLIVVVVIGSVTSWETFFTDFHEMFFAQGTWQFLYSDTLIRLFPEQFWFDSALLIGGLAVVSAIILLLIAWKMSSPPAPLPGGEG